MMNIHKLLERLDTDSAKRVALRLKRSDVDTAIIRPSLAARGIKDNSAFEVTLPQPICGIESVTLKQSAGKAAEKMLKVFIPVLAKLILKATVLSATTTRQQGFIGLMQYLLMLKIAEQNGGGVTDEATAKQLDQYLTDFYSGTKKPENMELAEEAAYVLAYAALCAIAPVINKKTAYVYLRVGEYITLELSTMALPKHAGDGLRRLHMLNPRKASKIFDDALTKGGFGDFVNNNDEQIKIGAYFVMLMKQAGLLITTNDDCVMYSEDIRSTVNDFMLAHLITNPLIGPVTYQPHDWKDFFNGGFKYGLLRSRTQFMISPKFSSSNAAFGIREYNNAFKQFGYFGEDGKIPEFMRANNIMQRVPFKINRDVFNTVTSLWQRGGGTAGLPISAHACFHLSDRAHEIRKSLFKPWRTAKYSKTKSNPTPDPYDKLDVQLTKFKEHMRGQANVDMREIEDFCDEYYELRCRGELSSNNAEFSKVINTIYALEEAYDLLDADKFYYVFVVDSRGRHYPKTSCLSIQGNDLHKALHLFADGKELTESGLYHLKLHTLNCLDKSFDGQTDLTKISLADRIAYFDKNAKLFHAIGEDPLGTLDMWKNAGEPFCFLAACCEYYNCCYKDGSIKYKAMTHLPIAKDGSCNALQYCAALSQDSVLAKEVNLIDGEKPGDVYTLVANAARNYLIAQRPLIGHEELIDEREGEVYTLDQVLGDAISLMSRKIAKQPTMTLFYGATYNGMREQIAGNIPTEYFVGKSAIYTNRVVGALTEAVRAGIAEKVAGADQLMDLNKFIARYVTKVGKRIIFNTLDEFMVVNDYRKADVKKLSVTANAERLFVRKYDATDHSDHRATAQGISPNLVHSMDATHMRMTLLDLHDNAGVTSFMMIHDSFAVNAEDCDELEVRVRRQFVKLINARPYSTILSEMLAPLDDDEYAQLLVEIQEAQEQGELPCIEVVDGKYLRLKVGTLDINNVLTSRFFFA